MASTSSATPSQSAPKLNYEVFLSFRGDDVRKNFLDHLYDKLKLKAIHTFKDDDQLRIGDSIGPRLLQAIEESRIAVVIFSEDYASSTWCLEEVAAIMECRDKHGQIVVPIFYKVEPSDVRKQKGSFGKSFAELEKRFNDEDGKAKIEGWKKALAKAADIKGHTLTDYNGYEAVCVQRVTDDIFSRLKKFIQATTTVLEKNIVGLESRVGEIRNLLRMEPNDARFIGIWGMGGIGKTTTARAVFKKFSNQFGGGACFLADIRQGNIIELQKRLIKKILNVRTDDIISNEHDGMETIVTRLKEKKVLIVLDDVDHVEQLDKLAGDLDWFGGGSRVIITTRDAGVLRSHGVDEKYIYEVHTLGDQKAIQLFECHAFKKEPKTGVEELCGSIVHYCKGLPLALKVLGSSLCGREAAMWKSTLDKLKNTPHKDIVATLKISFDGLDDEDKKIFLDIACFFRKKSRGYVEDALGSCGLHPDIGIEVLIERCLVFESYGDIDMHDLIQEFGWHVASQEKPRSRVWQPKDVDDVLSGKMEPKHIEGFLFSSTEEYRDDHNSSDALKAFEGMENLKILIVEYDSYRYCSESLESCWMSIMDYLPRKLMLLKFSQYPLSKLFCTKNSKELSVLDLSSSSCLLETPNFEEMPNLKRLNLSGCTALTQIHPSIGNLSKLVLLDLSDCSNLEKLPSFNQVSSLKSLKLYCCKKLNVFPEIKARTPNLVKLLLLEVGILELPSSIQQLHGLTKLRLDCCERLKRISNGLCELKNLEVLEIRDCSKVESLPENLQGLSSLEYLNLQRCGFVYLPESFSQLHRLHYLDITGCQKLEELPQLPSNIRELYADCRFAGGNNIADLAECSGLYSVSFSYHDYEDIQFNVGTLAKKFIHFPLHRKTPLCACYPITEQTGMLRSFKYRRYESNGISINLNSLWYSPYFEGFAICFLSSSECDIWRPHPYQHFDSHIEHCAVIIKLSHKDNDNEVFQIKCEIARSPSECLLECKEGICLIYIPFSSLWPESKTKMEANDYSRFRVEFINLKASADWGCSLLYKRRRTTQSRDGGFPGRTTDIGPLSKLEYLNLSGRNFEGLPEYISRLHCLQYLDISGCQKLNELPELPPNIRELYADYRLSSESNIAELATKYFKLNSVSFFDGDVTLSAKELPKKFIPNTEPFLKRNTPFVVTYTSDELYMWADINISRWFKNPSHASNKVSINLKPSWYSQTFVGFVVCFLLYPFDDVWESDLDGRPFRHCEVIAKLTHNKHNANEVIQTKCLIGGRLYEEKDGNKLVCFAYIPFRSLWSESNTITDEITPNHYMVFEAAFGEDFRASTDWSCGLLYTDDELLTEAIPQ